MTNPHPMSVQPITGFFDEYRFLSNFYSAEVFFDGLTYRTSEHAYQAAKSTYPVDRIRIRDLPHARLAKSEGQKLRLRDDWEVVKLEVMREILTDKFSHEPIKSKLAATYPAYLEETNDWGDTFWGVCNGKGKNHLGVLLMDIRDDIVRDLQEENT